MKFAGDSPFSHLALDIRTMAMFMLDTDCRESTKQNIRKRWFGGLPHAHVALDDARGQGMLSCHMLRELHAGVAGASP